MAITYGLTESYLQTCHGAVQHNNTDKDKYWLLSDESCLNMEILGVKDLLNPKVRKTIKDKLSSWMQSCCFSDLDEEYQEKGIHETICK